MTVALIALGALVLVGAIVAGRRWLDSRCGRCGHSRGVHGAFGCESQSRGGMQLTCACVYFRRKRR